MSENHFRELCQSIRHNACVISVQRTADGYGEIRVVEGNDGYRNSFSGEGYTKKEFIPNSLYTDFLAQNLNFEDFCYRCAVKKELLHSYAYPEYFKSWMHMIFVPLLQESEELSYCLYIMEINDVFNPELLASPRGDIYSKVLNTTLQLANTADFNQSLSNVAKEIRKICKAIFCCILLVDDENQKLEVLAQNRDPHATPISLDQFMSEKFYRIVKTWDGLVALNGNCVIVNNQKGMDFLKENAPEWFGSLSENNIHSLALFPIKSVNKVLGYMWVSNFEADDTPVIKEALEITTFVLGSQIANQLLLGQLTKLSSVDLLTGLYNRNKLNAYMHGVVESDDTPMGLVFLDINGLKKVNDQQGHLAGDELIKRAAKVLNDVFKGNAIFRVGGDEFVVILKAVNEEKILKYIDDLHVLAKQRDVSFAAGYAITDNHKEIEKALNEADFQMYKDKRKFYGQN